MAHFHHYTPVSKALTTELILKIFSYRKDFLHFIAPQGFEKSDFFHICRPKIYHEYLRYRYFRINFEDFTKPTKNASSSFFSKTLKEFTAETTHNKYPELNSPLESTLVMAKATSVIFDYPHVVFNQDMGCYRISDPLAKYPIDDLHEMLYQNQIIPNLDDSYYKPRERMTDYEYGLRNLKVDLYPAYVFIFQKLMEMRLDWDFGSFRHTLTDVLSPEALLALEQELDLADLDDHATYDPITAMLASLDQQPEDSSGEDAGIPEEEYDGSYIMRYHARIKKRVVDAYKAVYGHFPKAIPQLRKRLFHVLFSSV